VFWNRGGPDLYRVSRCSRKAGADSDAPPDQEVTITTAGSPSSSGLSARFVETLDIDRAAISTLGPPFDIETVSASDDIAARIMEFQLDSGEGPGWEAHRIQAPVIVSSLDDEPHSRWPIFTHAVSGLPVHGVYSLPLAIGAMPIGAVDLYAGAGHQLPPAEIETARILAASTARIVFEDAVRRHDVKDDGDGPFSRREVHQATGMVIAQLRIPAEEALLRIRAHAFANGRSVREIASDITARRLTLEP
jgi:hypothetical protein